MKALRILMIMVLTLAIPPWGAYAMPGPVQDGYEMRQVSLQGEVVAKVVTAQMRATRYCKGGVLAPCHSDLGLLPDGVQPPAGTHGDIGLPPRWQRLQSITPRRSTDPPRLG